MAETLGIQWPVVYHYYADSKRERSDVKDEPHSGDQFLSTPENIAALHMIIVVWRIGLKCIAEALHNLIL